MLMFELCLSYYQQTTLSIIFKLWICKFVLIYVLVLSVVILSVSASLYLTKTTYCLVWFLVIYVEAKFLCFIHLIHFKFDLTFFTRLNMLLL